MTDSADYNGPTDEEKREALKPGSKFWQEFNERMQREAIEMEARANHPAVLAAQESLHQMLVKSALEMPEVLALIAAARACVKGTTYVGQSGEQYKLYMPPSPTEIVALDQAITAVEARAR